MKKFAVVLSGCGVFDGSEIHEATLTLLAIKKAGHNYQIFAPDMPQLHVINHYKGEVANEQRNVLCESARIARGQAKPLSQFDVNDFDAIVFPGGFGVAKNLCNYAVKGADCTVNPDVERVIRDMHTAHKPIGALCIAPVLLARIFGNVQITVGAASNDAVNVEKMGASHIVTSHGEVVVDKVNRLYTTPCYMLDDATIVQIAQGADNLIQAILKDS